MALEGYEPRRGSAMSHSHGSAAAQKTVVQSMRRPQQMLTENQNWEDNAHRESEFRGSVFSYGYFLMHLEVLRHAPVFTKCKSGVAVACFLVGRLEPPTTRNEITLTVNSS